MWFASVNKTLFLIANMKGTTITEKKNHLPVEPLPKQSEFR